MADFVSIDFKKFVSLVPRVAKARLPVLLRGRHGIGKSCVVYQFAERCAEALDGIDRPVVERRASQMMEGDLIGLPDNRSIEVEGKKATTFNPPDWFVLACAKPVVLFLDEVDRATPEVRQGIFQLTDSRALNGHRLHPDTLIFAAVNGGEHGSEYQVGEMDPAELDRWTCFDLNPTIEDWLDWGADNVVDVIWDFINQHRNQLEYVPSEGGYEPNKVYPSRRSWERLSNIGEDLWNEPKTSSEDIFYLAAATVGFEAASALAEFMRNYDRQVTPEDIMDKGLFDKVKDFTITDHSALLEKMKLLEDRWTEKLSDEVIANLAEYYVTLPSECAIVLMSIIGSAGPESLDNVRRFHRYNVPGKGKVSDYTKKMFQKQNNKEDKE